MRVLFLKNHTHLAILTICYKKVQWKSTRKCRNRGLRHPITRMKWGSLQWVWWGIMWTMLLLFFRWKTTFLFFGFGGLMSNGCVYDHCLGVLWGLCFWGLCDDLWVWWGLFVCLFCEKKIYLFFLVVFMDVGIFCLDCVFFLWLGELEMWNGLVM